MRTTPRGDPGEPAGNRRSDSARPLSDLLVAPASHEQADYAARNWHYSGCLPTGKLVKVGAWEAGELSGVVVFSRGASPYLGRAYDLAATEICELTRMAFRRHDAPLSRIVSLALRVLRETNPGLRLVVSFADPARDHHGGIYQATNWIYTGLSNEVGEYFIGGRWRHTRAVYHEARAFEKATGRPVPTRTQPGKHRYCYPLDKKMRRLIEPLRLPYPKPDRHEAPDEVHVEELGATAPAGREER